MNAAAPPPAERQASGLVFAELALVAVTATVVLGMARLFDSLDYLPTVAVAAAAAHLLAILTRRGGIGTGLSLVLSFLVMVLVLTWLEYPDTTGRLMPTTETWRVFSEDIRAAWDAFGVVKAPTEALPGFVVGAAVAVWTAATLADLAAFRVHSAAEALVPAGSIFLFTAMLGDHDHRLAGTVAFAATSILFVLAFRIDHPPTGSVPIGATARRRGPALARAGLGVAFAAMVLGLLAGPLLPGADAAPVVDWRELDGGGGSGPRVTLSPLVDTRGRLVTQSDTVVFTVRADRPAFWRTTALDRFDGAVWGSNNNYEVARGDLVAADQPDTGELIQQEFTIEALSDIWLPAAYTPTSVDGVDARWDDQSSTLIIREASTTPGLVYTVQSLSPTAAIDREELLSASGEVPIGIRARYTELPVGFDPAIREQALQITDPWPTTYEKALALQNFFLDNFRYSLEVSTGHGNDRMAQFLFDQRTGYCEQFAGTFAAMARSVGIPARVATGFTPGELVDDQYVVRGENYHAWPEVWIDGRWVYFEPTPGRGAPGATGYTGVPEQQVQPTPDETEATDTTGNTAVPTVPPFEDFPEAELGGLEGEASQAGDDSGLPTWLERVGQVIGVALLLGLLWWLIAPLLRRLRRRRRYASARTVAAQVEAAWMDLNESLAVAGVPAAPAETPREYARRVHQVTRIHGARLDQVATLVTEARYADDVSDDQIAAHARHLVAELESELREQADGRQRFLRRIDPRPLLRR
jgi:transglutaminase-like putative cysteine protease